MKKLFVTFLLLGLMPTLSPAHEIQHGFILSANDSYASHLVANGQHSHQVSISATLTIPNPLDQVFYRQQKAASSGKTYFLFQAQKLDLPSIHAGQVLVGHIVESKVGDYQPENIIVENATLKVNEVQINVENPFFK